MNLADFIVQHQNDDISDLILHRDRYPDVDVALAAECIAARRKLRYKVPEWYADAELICPVALSAEQCSSTATARYKAAVAEEACRLPLEAIREEQRARPCPVKGPRSGHCSSASLQPALPTSLRIADLTGGLGVDCWQFSRIADSVLYNEMNPVLLDAARHNLPRLGCTNVIFSGLQIGPDNLPGLLDGFRPDLVFADPARRAGNGRKVFLPEDCMPDILSMQDMILDRGMALMVKLSPMADISLMLKKFHHASGLHIVQSDGECKELLLICRPDFDAETLITVADAVCGPLFSFVPSEASRAVPALTGVSPDSGRFLFEPGPALAKSGAFNLLCKRFAIKSLGASAHLFIADSPLPQLEKAGKWFRIAQTAPFGKAAMKEFASKWPDAELSARAMPLGSDSLKDKMGLRGGGPVHIFAAGSAAGRLLIAAYRI